jgi:WD40 repeat protein
LKTGERKQTIHSSSEVQAVAVSRDDNHIIWGENGGRVTIWDLQMQNAIASRQVSSDGISAVAFSSDAKHFISSGYIDGTLTLWGLSKYNKIQKLRTFAGHSSRVTSIATSRSGVFFLSASRDRTIKLWNYNQYEPMRVFEGHLRDVTGVALTEDEKTIVSASYDGKVGIWNIDGPHINAFLDVSEALDEPRNQVSLSAIAIVTEGRVIAGVVPGRFMLALLEISSMQLLHSFKKPSNRVNLGGLLGGGRNVLAAWDGQALRVLSLETGNVIQSLDGPPSWSHRLSVGKRRIAAGDFVGKLRISDVLSGRQVYPTIKAHDKFSMRWQYQRAIRL